MTKEKKETKCDDLIDALLEKHGKSPEAVLGENGLIAQLKKRVVERALAGELTHHLGYAKGEAPEELENHRNENRKAKIANERRLSWQPRANTRHRIYYFTGSSAACPFIQLLIQRLTSAKKRPVERPYMRVPIAVSSGASVRHCVGNARVSPNARTRSALPG